MSIAVPENMEAVLPLSESREKIGLVAGWGDYPIRVAQSLKRQGHSIVCLGIKDHASENLASICDEFRMFGLGQMGAQARFLKRAGVAKATMAGKIFKVRIFRRFHFWQHFPDLLTWRHFYPMLVSKTRDRRDDTLLGTVTELYASQGIQFVPATDFAPELLVRPGVLTRKSPTASQMKDIAFGWPIAKEMGRLDIGQSVVVKNQAVIAVEAIEGTDPCIRRAGELCQCGFSVIKVAKPQQDMRFDVPTVGVGTIETIFQSGGSLLAIEAGKTIILDQENTVRSADRHGICIVSIQDGNF
jgi:UDP-2,3-diacylglucosamine hydrolase